MNELTTDLIMGIQLFTLCCIIVTIVLSLFVYFIRDKCVNPRLGWILLMTFVWGIYSSFIIMVLII